MWGDSYVPIEKLNNSGTYNGASIGVNELNSSRATIAIGYGNKITSDFGTAIGAHNTVSGSGVAIGNGSTVSSNGVALGSGKSTGSAAVAIGDGTEANCNNMFAAGKYNAPANTNFRNLEGNTFYEAGEFVNGKVMSNMPTLTFICTESHTSPSGITLVTQDINPNTQLSYWTLAPSNGDTLFALGNGNNANKSNALKVDWRGNVKAGGDVYVHANADSSGGTKLATVDDIPVQDVQVNGTSVVSDGIADIPVAGSNLGVVKILSSNGIVLDTSNQLKISAATSALIKGATNQVFPIVPAYEHEAVFYGLAKAAGDAT